MDVEKEIIKYLESPENHLSQEILKVSGGGFPIAILAILTCGKDAKKIKRHLENLKNKDVIQLTDGRDEVRLADIINREDFWFFSVKKKE
jgi:hypothetical protein